MTNMTTNALNGSHDDDSKHMKGLLNATDAFSIYSAPDTAYWVCTVIYVVIGLIGNALVFPLMKDVKFSSLSYPVYLMSLAVSDSAVLIIYSIQLSLKFFESFHIIGKYVAACRIWMFLMSSVNLLSPWLVVGLTIDLFYCVVFPLTRHRFCTRRKAAVVCSCLATMSVLLMLPLLEGVKVVDTSDVCFVEDHLVIYIAFFRLIISSNLPCLLILVLNIVTGIHIQRSATFRKRFISSTSSGFMENHQDKSLLPLILISILAFVTTLPSSIVDTVVGVLIVTESDPNSLITVAKFVLPFNFLYLINFGQNFYILMASSANYRDVIKRKMNFKNIPSQKEDVSERRVRPSMTESNTISFSYTDATTSIAISDAAVGYRSVFY